MKITLTPAAFTMQQNKVSKKDSIPSVFNKSLNADTVNFTAKNKVLPIETLVSRAFSKLAKNRNGSNLGMFMATSPKSHVNIFLQETKFGKEAKLSLTNGIFGDKSYANFNIKKSQFGKKVDIFPADEDMSANEAVKLVHTYLQDIK